MQDRYAGFLDHLQGLRKKKKSRRSKGEVVANRALVYEIQEDSDDVPEDFNRTIEIKKLPILTDANRDPKGTIKLDIPVVRDFYAVRL